MKLMDDIHDCGELFLELERRIRMVRSAREYKIFCVNRNFNRKRKTFS